jgi:pyochelin biosynthetic protein PchC
MRMPTRNDTGWLRCFHPAPDTPVRLACFPHAGGSASFYFTFSKALARHAEVLAVQYPGRQDRWAESRVEDLHELARGVFEALRTYTDRPLALFGHSMGSTVAFETARLLEHEAGIAPVVLFASGRRAPSVPPQGRYLHTEGDDALLADLQAMSGTDSRLLAEDDLLREVLAVLRSDYKAGETYRYRAGPDLGCPITAYVGDDDPKAPVEDVRLWARHTSGGFSLTVFPGSHFYLKDQAETVAGAVSEQLMTLNRDT